MGETQDLGLPTILVAGIIGMLLLAFAIIVFFVVYQKRLLQQQEKMNRREAEYQKELLRASIQSQEAERKRIASDLHDSVGALLSATKMYLKQIGIGSAENLPDIKKESLGLVDETIQNVRHISHNLLPPALERFGLGAALEDLAEKINHSGTINFEMHYDERSRLELETEIGLYRIIQELCNNTIKHADAKNIQLLLERTDTAFQIIYRDDGNGFDLEDKTDQQSRKKGLGLRSLESRANALNARFKLESAVGKGMTAIIELPKTDLLPDMT